MQTNDETLIARLEAALDRLERPVVPLEDQLWTLAEVAAYFRRNTQVVRETMTCLPSFPKAVRLPSKGRAHPLYNAGEVVEWARKHREKH